MGGPAITVPVRIATDPAALAHGGESPLRDALDVSLNRALDQADAVAGVGGAKPLIKVTFTGPGVAAVPTSDRRRTAVAVQQTISSVVAQRSTRGATRTPPTKRGAALSAPPWRIRNDIRFRTTVESYLDYHTLVAQSDFRALYFDFLDQVRPARAWLVELSRLYWWPELVAQISARAVENAHLPAGRTLAWSITPSEHHRRSLIAIDHDGVLAQGLASLSGNDTRLFHQDGQRLLRPNVRVLLASMALPVIRLDDYVALRPPVRLSVRASELSFLASAAAVQELFGVPFKDYVAELDDPELVVTAHPLTIQRKASNVALNAVLRRGGPPRPEDSARFDRLALLNRSTLNSLPPALTSRLDPLETDATTLALPADEGSASWLPGWRGAYIYVDLPGDKGTLGVVRDRPLARAAVDAYIAFVNRGLGRLARKFALESLLLQRLPVQTPVGGRPTFFDFFVEELQRRDGGRWWREFEQDLDEPTGDLKLRLVQCATASLGYGEHPLFKRLREQMIAFTRQLMRNTYFPQTNDFHLDHRADRLCRAGQVVGDLNEIYVDTKTIQRMNPGRAEEFRRVLDEEKLARMRLIASGQDVTEYDENSFADVVVKAAGARMKFSEKDFEEVNHERSVRFLSVELTTEHGVERWRTTFEFVERTAGGGWTTIPGTRTTESLWNFEMILLGLEMGNIGKMLETIGLAITIIGITLVAWEAEVIAALISLAGGGWSVGISIAISEIIYLATAEHYSLQGFLVAAVDGYLGALGFRFVGMGARAVAGRIGTKRVLWIISGWTAEKVITGAVGGAVTAAAIKFNHDLIAVLLGEGQWSSPREYIEHMVLGGLFGVAAEFGVAVLAPVLKVGGRTALESVSEWVGILRTEGVTAGRLAAQTARALEGMGARFRQFLDEATAVQTLTAIRDRMARFLEALEQVPGAARRHLRFGTFRRILELAEVELDNAATDGLERLLNVSASGAGRIGEQELVDLFNRIARNPGQTRAFFQGVSRLVDQQVVDVIAAGQIEAFANSVHLLRNLASRDKDMMWAVWQGRFGLRVSEIELWLRRISAHPDERQMLAIANLGGTFISPEAMALTLERTGDITVSNLAGLNNLYRATAGVGTRDALLTVTPQANFDRFLNFVGERGFDELGHMLNEGALGPLSRAARVLEFLQMQGNMRLLRRAVADGAGNRAAADWESVVRELDRLFERNPQLGATQQMELVRELPELLNLFRRTGRDVGHAIELTGNVAARPGVPIASQVPDAMRLLLTDDIAENVALRMLQPPQLPPGRAVTSIAAAGPGQAGTDLLFALDNGTFIGREATSSNLGRQGRPAPGTLTDARGPLLDNLINRLDDKATQLARDAARGRRFASAEIDMHVRSPPTINLDPLLDDAQFLAELSQRVRAEINNAVPIQRIRFYRNDQTLAFTWEN